MNPRIPAFVFLSVMFSSAFAQTAPEPVTRAVWIQQLSGEPDPYGTGNVFRLMARELPSPPRVLLSGPGNFSRPLLSVDGNTVYYSDRHAVSSDAGTAYSPEMFAVPFAGGEPRKLGTGMAVAVWRSAEGTEFIYALTSLQASHRPGLTGELLVRFRAEKPDEREIMWTESPLGADNFQLSRDGTRAAGLFPWPQAGLADMSQRAFTPLAQGSFPALAPDDSFALGVLDGDRRRLRIFVPGVDPGWELLPAQSLPAQAGQINHPRWSNDPLTITFSGPPVSGEAPDVYVAKLRPDLRAILQAAPLSSDPAPDFFPDVHVTGGHERTTSLTQHPATTVAPAAVKWPASQDGLQFSWENGNAPGAPEKFKLHDLATPGRYGSLNVSAGWADIESERIKRLGEACAASGAFTFEATITERRTQVPCSIRILSLQSPDKKDAFALYRVDRSLVLRILTGGGEGKPPVVERQTLTPLSISDDVPFTLCVTIHAGTPEVYLDGKPLKEVSLDQPGLQAWKDLHLTVGDPDPYGTPWTGQVERIAFYSRALAAAEVADDWKGTEAVLSNRQLPTRNKIKARLLEMPPLPDAAALAASPRWLNATSWEIEQVLSGYIQPKKIIILYWAWLDGKPAPLPDIKPGQSMELSVESLDDHPELRTEKTHNAVKAGEQPVFFDTTPPGRHLKPFPQ
jgi:hypothetical protein